MPNKKMKKAQLQTGETIIVLIIFFILLAGGMVFYAKIQVYTGAKKGEEVQELNAISIEQRIRYMSEIACTIDASVIFDCYDVLKIQGLQNTIQTYSLYYSAVIFPHSRVLVTSVYPDEWELVLYDFGDAAESTSLAPFRTPVTLYDPRDDMYNFGYVTIEVYS